MIPAAIEEGQIEVLDAKQHEHDANLFIIRLKRVAEPSPHWLFSEGVFTLSRKDNWMIKHAEINLKNYFNRATGKRTVNAEFERVAGYKVPVLKRHESEDVWKSASGRELKLVLVVENTYSEPESLNGDDFRLKRFGLRNPNASENRK